MLLDTYSSASVLKSAYLAKNVRNCNAEEKLLMLKTGGHLHLNQMREILLLPMMVHINESSTESILYFAEVSDISGVNINMDTSK